MDTPTSKPLAKKRFYIEPRKICEDCKFKNHIKGEAESLTYYCKLTSKFSSPCDRKIPKTFKDEV